MTIPIACLAGTAADAGIHLLPKPASVKPLNGSYTPPKTVALRVTKQAQAVARTTIERTASADLSKRVRLEAEPGDGWHLRMAGASIPDPPHGEEAYRLNATTDGIALSASTEPGFRHGVRTLLQLLSSSAKIPACEIDDRPALALRGLMIDMVRLKEKDEFYFRLLDEIAAWKMNALFVHFTDGQGCSVELKSHPELVTRHAMSQDTVRKLIARGAELGVRVIPEVEAWGHAQWITRHHPELAEPDSNSLCLANEDIYPLLEDVIKEVAGLFPDPYLHIGCDEAAVGRDDNCRALIAKIGEDRMIANHINRLNRIVKKCGKTSIIWGDIVLQPNSIMSHLDKDIIIENWDYRADVTDEHLRKLLAAGFQGIVAPTLICGGWRVMPADATLENVRRLSAYAKEHSAGGIATTVWLPQRYVPRSIGPGIAWAADQAWNPGGRDLKGVMGTYLVQRFRLEPTEERIDRMVRLGRVGQREGSMKAGFWWKPDMLAWHGTDEARENNASYTNAVKGLEAGFKHDLPAVKTHRDDFESLALAAEIGEHLARRPPAGMEVVKRVNQAQEAIGRDDAAGAGAELLAAAKVLREIEAERAAIFARTQEIWDRDRYQDDPERSGEDRSSNNLMWWFGTTDSYGYTAHLAEKLEEFAKKPDAATLRLILPGS